MIRNTMRAHCGHFAHEADIGVPGTGASAASAFEQAAVAMTAIVGCPGALAPQRSMRIECDATDEQLLLAQARRGRAYAAWVRKA